MVIEEPPEAPAVKVKINVPDPPVAVSKVGALGVVEGVALTEFDAVESPAELDALIVIG